MFHALIGPDTNRGVGAAFTDRHGGASAGDLGPLNLGRTEDDDLAAVETNFSRVLRAIEVDTVVTAHQVHGAEVLIVDADLLRRWGHRSHLGTRAGQDPLPVADAMVTTEAGVALCIRVADCVPVLLADPQAGVVAAAHAGREGLVAGVLSATVAAMHDLGARDVTAWVGPHICGACYEVPQDLAARVAASHPRAVSTTRWGTPSLDLGEGVEAQLGEMGVTTVRLDPCTRTEPSLHSHRRDGVRAGRLGGFIWRVSGRT